MSNTPLQKLIADLKEKGYTNADYHNNTIRFVIKDTEDRDEKIKEYKSAIDNLILDGTEIKWFDVLYPDEIELGIAYRPDVVKELLSSLPEIKKIQIKNSVIVIDFFKSPYKNLSLRDYAKSHIKDIFKKTIKKYHSRKLDLKFRIRYGTGTTSFTIDSNDNLSFEGLTPLSEIDFSIIKGLSNLSLNQFHTIRYADNNAKEEFIWTLENLRANDIIEIENFNPDSYNLEDEPNYPESFQVKLLETKYTSFI